MCWQILRFLLKHFDGFLHSLYDFPNEAFGKSNCAHTWNSAHWKECFAVIQYFISNHGQQILILDKANSLSPIFKLLVSDHIQNACEINLSMGVVDCFVDNKSCLLLSFSNNLMENVVPSTNIDDALRGTSNVHQYAKIVVFKNQNCKKVFGQEKFDGTLKNIKKQIVAQFCSIF